MKHSLVTSILKCAILIESISVINSDADYLSQTLNPKPEKVRFDLRSWYVLDRAVYSRSGQPNNSVDVEAIYGTQTN